MLNFFTLSAFAQTFSGKLNNKMSDLNQESKNETDFEDFLAEEGFEGPIGTMDSASFYECPGGHFWHEDEVKKLYEEKREKK